MPRASLAPNPRRAVVLAAILCASLARPAPGAQPPPTQAEQASRGQNVFVTGHSFHVPSARPFDQIALSAGIDGHRLAGIQGIGGSSVTRHWDLPDDQDRARKAIKAGEVDVLTVAPFLNPLPDPAIAKFAALLLEHNPKGRVMVQASWMPMDGPGSNFAAFKNAERDAAEPATFRTSWAPFLDKMRDQVVTLNEELAGKAGRPVVFLVPVADAVIRLRERVVKGEVPGIAKQSQLFRDNLGHGLAPITVLTAYCHFATIYGRNPTGLPVPDVLKGAGLGDNTEKMNRILQEIAWEAVTAEPLSGVKPPRAD
jgi:hypothetical protein